MSSNNSKQPVTIKQVYKPPPAAALKRFAADLAADSSANKFLEINLERVTQFVHRQPLKGDDSTKEKDKRTCTSSSKIPGIMDYSFLDSPEKKGIIKLQQVPEFQKSLGIRCDFYTKSNEIQCNIHYIC